MTTSNDDAYFVDESFESASTGGDKQQVTTPRATRILPEWARGDDEEMMRLTPTPSPPRQQQHEERFIDCGGREVGFGNLPHQLQRKSLSDGFCFNVLIIGE